MHRRSFLVGFVAGGVLALLLVLAVPGLAPRRGAVAGQARAPRESVVVREEIQLPPPPAPEEASADPAEPTSAAKSAGEKEAKPTGPDAQAVMLYSRRTAAVATLRNIISAQAQFQTTARADENRNGVGEYGSFAELSGAIGVRDGDVLNPPVLSSAFRKVERGLVERSGYRYRIYLPQAGGRALGERDRGGYGGHEIDADLAESCWCCYAWPVDAENPTFFVNQAGDILSTPAGCYAGDREPPAYAAFRDASGLTAPTVIDLPEGQRIGADGREWKQAG